MPIDETKLNNLLSNLRANKTVAECEILTVYWSDAVTKHYSISNYSNIAGFSNCSLSPIEPRLLGKQFHAFELNAEISQEQSITFTFDNNDKSISALFETHGEGVKCEISYYYPDQNLLIPSVWFGRLSKPSTDYSILTVTATNGFGWRNMPLPNLTKPEFCQNTFGGKFSTNSEAETAGCPYNRHRGGSIGNLNGGQPFTECARDSKSTCSTVLGYNGRYFNAVGSGEWNVEAVVTDRQTGYSAFALKNKTILTQNTPLVLGACFVKEPRLLFYRREFPSWVREVIEISLGEIDYLYNVTRNGNVISSLHIQTRNGELGQEPLSYAPNMPSFSGVAHLSVAWQPSGGAGNYTPSQGTFLVAVHGYKNIAVFSDSETYVRQWSNNRVWQLLELMTNKRFGLRYSHDRFNIQSFIDSADWRETQVEFNWLKLDGTTAEVEEIRDRCSLVLTGKPAGDVVNGFCKTGRMFFFQHAGQYEIKDIRTLSAEELTEVKVFYDTGENRNIIYRDDMPSLRITQEPADKIANKVTVIFTDASNQDNERPITAIDQNQQLLAGKVKGLESFFEVEKKVELWGIRELNIAVKLAYLFLYFGEQDSGGVKNNCRISFQTDYLEVANLKKGDVFKMVSAELEGIGYTNPITDDFYQFEYFRVLSLTKDTTNTVTVNAIAYHAEEYANFETELLTTPETSLPTADVFPVPTQATINTVTYDEDNQVLEVVFN